MKSISKFLLAGLAAIWIAGPATSQTESASSPPTPIPPTEAMAMSQAPHLSPSQRAAIAKDLITKWQGAAAKRPGGDGPRWARILAKAVASADAANVLQATNARSVDEVHAALTGASFDAVQPQASTGTIGNGAVAPQILGSVSNDLVYTPLPNGRCRIADSRVINSPLVGTRNLLIEDIANYAAQGGNGTYSSGTGSAACGINYYTAAYAVSVTLISPAAAGGFKVFRYGLPYQTGSSVWMNAGSSGASADLIVRSCQGCAAELGIYSAASVHYVIDVIGYYMRPQGTPIQCLNTTYVTQTIAPNGTFNIYGNYCSNDYTMTETICQSNQFDVTFGSGGNGQCHGRNRSSNNADVSVTVKCCRIPGR